LRDLKEARRVLLEDSLRGVEVVSEYDGPVVDVGSGGGAPGIPLAVALPEREVTLLEANGRKCEFLRRWAPPNARVVQGRAEEQAVDEYDVAVAKALAPPPVAAEWCLPLVRPGGAAILWVGPTADRERVVRTGRARERDVDLRPARRRAAPRARAADQVSEPAPRSVEAGARRRLGRACAARRRRHVPP